jgi:hypothetical protein
MDLVQEDIDVFEDALNLDVQKHIFWNAKFSKVNLTRPPKYATVPSMILLLFM